MFRGLVAPGTDFPARGSVCGGRRQHGDSRTASGQFLGQTERLAPQTSGGRVCSAMCGERLVLCAFGSRMHIRSWASRAPSEGVRARGPAGSKAVSVYLNVLGKNADCGGTRGGGDEAWPGTPGRLQDLETDSTTREKCENKHRLPSSPTELGVSCPGRAPPGLRRRKNGRRTRAKSVRPARSSKYTEKR